MAAPASKKRAWSWPSYLEEERAVAAPVKLFKEVKFNIPPLTPSSSLFSLQDKLTFCSAVFLSCSISRSLRVGTVLRWGWSWKDWTRLTRLFSVCSPSQRYRWFYHGSGWRDNRDMILNINILDLVDEASMQHISSMFEQTQPSVVIIDSRYSVVIHEWVTVEKNNRLVFPECETKTSFIFSCLCVCFQRRNVCVVLWCAVCDWTVINAGVDAPFFLPGEILILFISWIIYINIKYHE